MITYSMIMIHCQHIVIIIIIFMFIYHYDCHHHHYHHSDRFASTGLLMLCRRIEMAGRWLPSIAGQMDRIPVV